MESSFDHKVFQYELGTFQDNDVIWVICPYDLKLIEMLKSTLKVRWYAPYKKWYVPDTNANRRIFNLPGKYISERRLSSISPENRMAYDTYISHLQLKAYSENTIKCYAVEFCHLLQLLKHFPVKDLSPERLRSYIYYCIKTLKHSENAIHSKLNAVKYYFEQVLHREQFFMDIPRPKKPSLLPKALSTKEIKKMLQTIHNLKHQMIFKLCYGMGLRVSEIVNLKIAHIDSERMQVLVASGKGKKDRYVVLPESILDDLRSYYKAYQPQIYLFEGQHGGQYSIRSVQHIFKKAMLDAGIQKKIGVHALRHSYATHLIEQGTDIRFVQELLGHKDIKTTMIYTSMTDHSKRKIKSPLDML